MDKINELALQINRQLLAEDLIKEYLKLEEKVANKYDLVQIEKDIKELQKIVVASKNQNDDFNSYEQMYQDKLNQFNDNPLLANYLNLKEEVNNYLQMIATMIKQSL